MKHTVKCLISFVIYVLAMHEASASSLNIIFKGNDIEDGIVSRQYALELKNFRQEDAERFGNQLIKAIQLKRYVDVYRAQLKRKVMFDKSVAIINKRTDLSAQEKDKAIESLRYQIELLVNQKLKQINTEEVETSYIMKHIISRQLSEEVNSIGATCSGRQKALETILSDTEDITEENKKRIQKEWLTLNSLITDIKVLEDALNGGEREPVQNALLKILEYSYEDILIDTSKLKTLGQCYGKKFSDCVGTSNGCFVFVGDTPDAQHKQYEIKSILPKKYFDTPTSIVLTIPGNINGHEVHISPQVFFRFFHINEELVKNVRLKIVLEDGVYLTEDLEGMFDDFLHQGNGLKLQEIEIGKVNSPKNIWGMSYTFRNCKMLEKLDLKTIDTTNVCAMIEVFKDCVSLRELNINNFNTVNVEDMSKMFCNCKNLKKLNISKFNTINVENMCSMFAGCKTLEEQDLSNFNTSNVEDMSKMFCGCKNLKKLNISKFNTGNVGDMSTIFAGCESLEEQDLSNFNTSSVEDMSKMFCNCKNLKKLNISNFNTENVENMCSMFAGCKRLQKQDLSNFNTSKVTDMSKMFCGCKNLKKLNISNFNTENVENMCSMFAGCKTLEEQDLSNFNTSKVANMSRMFCGCKNLKKLNISKFNTINVENMCSMFAGCKRLQEQDLSNFNTTKVANMSEMFSGCKNLKKLNINNFDTSNVTDMSKMFCGCKKLRILDLSNFDVSNVEDIDDMFAGCENLMNLKIKQSTLEQLLKIDANLFQDCGNLKIIDAITGNEISLSSFYQ